MLLLIINLFVSVLKMDVFEYLTLYRDNNVLWTSNVAVVHFLGANTI